MLVERGRLTFGEPFESWLEAATDPRTVRIALLTGPTRTRPAADRRHGTRPPSKPEPPRACLTVFASVPRHPATTRQPRAGLAPPTAVGRPGRPAADVRVPRWASGRNRRGGSAAVRASDRLTRQCHADEAIGVSLNRARTERTVSRGTSSGSRGRPDRLTADTEHGSSRSLSRPAPALSLPVSGGHDVLSPRLEPCGRHKVSSRHTPIPYSTQCARRPHVNGDCDA